MPDTNVVVQFRWHFTNYSSTRGSGSRSSGGNGGGGRQWKSYSESSQAKLNLIGGGSNTSSSNSSSHHQPARSKSRERSDHGDHSVCCGVGGDVPGSGATSSCPMQRQPQSPRKVDSIASALVGHS